MVLTYHPDQKQITLNMNKYVEGCLEEFEQNNSDLKIVNTPATENLFRIRNEDGALQLSKGKQTQFHSVVTKLLFLAKRG
jgi:hypothetical protein